VRAPAGAVRARRAGCCAGDGAPAAASAASPPPAPALSFTYRQLTLTASKVIETFKVISVLYVLLNAQGIVNMVCDTPAVLLGKPGWDAVSTVPSYLGGSRMYPSHWAGALGYSPAEVHAVTALYAATVDYAWFMAVLLLEVFSLTVTLVTWGAVGRFSWAQLYGWVSFVLALLWAGYEQHQYLAVTLHDGGADETFYCTVPYLHIVCRSFTYIHFIIAGFYFGLAIGLGDCALCGLAPDVPGLRYCTVRRKRQARRAAGTASSTASSTAKGGDGGGWTPKGAAAATATAASVSVGTPGRDSGRWPQLVLPGESPPLPRLRAPPVAVAAAAAVTPVPSGRGGGQSPAAGTVANPVRAAAAAAATAPGTAFAPPRGTGSPASAAALAAARHSRLLPAHWRDTTAAAAPAGDVDYDGGGVRAVRLAAAAVAPAGGSSSAV
jgi:hypothetical protein